MHFIQFLFLVVFTNIYICKSDEENNVVYRNLYGSGDYNYSLIKTVAKLTTGALKFFKHGSALLAQEIKDTTPESNEEYDFIVVGAGSAGAAIAARLSEIDDVTVLLIEAGGKEILLYDIPLLAPILQLSDSIKWNYETETSNAYCLAQKERRCYWPTGKVMGGGSVLNFLLATRGHPLDYDGWANLGNAGWSYNDTLKYFKKLEEIDIPEYREDKELRSTEGPVPISHLFHTPLAEAFIKAGVEQGYPIIDNNGDKRIGYSYVQFTAKNGERMSTNRAYVYPNSDRKNLFVSKKSHVNKVLIEPASKRAYGVEFTKFGKNIQVKARKEVILCAGAIGSPQILMRSGIGPSDHLKDVNIEVIQDAPVGKNLMDHLFYTGLVFLIDQPISITLDIVNPLNPYLVDYLNERDGPFASSVGEVISFIDVDKPNDLNAYPNAELLLTEFSYASLPITRYVFKIADEYWEKTFANISGRHSYGIYPFLLRPRSRGELLLRDKNPNTKPKLVANYFDDPEDMRVMIKAIRAAIKVTKTKALQRFKSEVYIAQIPGCEGYEYDSDDYWECAARAFTLSVYHQSGTCKMAPENDASGVVNPRLQVKGIKRLRVADASIMPTIVSGHTNIPTIMIGEKAADMIKEDWGYIVQ